MTSKRRNRDRKEKSSTTSASKGFQFITIIFLLQSVSLSLTQEIGDICAGKPFGAAIEDLTDCTGYYECLPDAQHTNCPSGQRFDAVTESCVDGKCPPCKCETVITTTITSPTEEPTTPSIVSSTSTELPTSSESSTFTVSESSESTEVSSSTSPTPLPECSNEPYCQTSEHNTFHRDRQDCRKFYVCRNGEAVAQTCDSGMYFDESTNACNYPSVVSCSPSACSSKPIESSSAAPSTESTTAGPTTEPSTEPTTAEPTTAPSTEPTTAEPTTEPTTTEPTTEPSTSKPITSTSTTPGSECSNEPYCQASEHGTFHRDRKDCKKYYICLNGDAVAQTCNGGMYFDEVINACNFPSLVSCSPCSTKPTGSPSSTEPTTASSSSSSSVAPSTEPTTTASPSTSSSSESSSSTKTSSKPSTSSSESSTTSTPEAVCTTEPNCQVLQQGTFHRDKKNCRKYYVCLNGNAIELFCSPGQYFDDVSNVCNYESNVKCTSVDENCKPITAAETPTTTSSTLTTKTTTKAPTTSSSSISTTLTSTSKPSCPSEPNCKVEPHGSVHRDSKNCARFYVCKNGASIGLSCRNGEYFDLNTNVCLFSSLVDCTPTENCSPTQTPTSTSARTLVTQTTVVPNGQVDPNITDCKNLPNRSVLRDSVHCNVYYVCRNKMAVRHSCPYHQWFDSERMLCNFRNLVDCPSGMD